MPKGQEDLHAVQRGFRDDQEGTAEALNHIKESLTLDYKVSDMPEDNHRSHRRMAAVIMMLMHAGMRSQRSCATLFKSLAKSLRSLEADCD